MVSNYQIALARSCNLSTPVCPILFKSFNACIKVSCFNLAWQMCTGWQRRVEEKLVTKMEFSNECIILGIYY